jgi:hypothetical protein
MLEHRPLPFAHIGGASFRVESWIRLHPRKGHDRALTTPSFAGVADGATPLQEAWPDSGAFAQLALEALERAAAGDGRIRDIWANAIEEAGAKELAPQPEVSCSVAIVRSVGTSIEVSVLGDCTAIVITDDARHVVHDPAVQELDARAARLTTDKAATLLRHRALMNTGDGYWIFSKDPAAADHVLHLTVPAHDVREVILHTDGLQGLIDPANPQSMADQMSALVIDLGRTFADDAACVRLSVLRSPR